MLIKALDDGYSDFYIHVDKKIECFPKIDSSNIYYLDVSERIDVQWASYQMIEATIALIKKCINSNLIYDYVILLSGQDYPIMSSEKIQRFLSDNVPNNYIEVLEDDNPILKRYEKRNSIIYPKWIINRSFFIKCVKKIYIYISGGYNKTFVLFKRKKTIPMRFYYGSQWWALRRECLQWMISYLGEHPEFCDFFKLSITPDECFFQTLFMASPFAEQRANRIIYFEWDKNQNNPKLIDKNKANDLIHNNNIYLFARKFDLTVDDKAIEIINNYFNN